MRCYMFGFPEDELVQKQPAGNSAGKSVGRFPVDIPVAGFQTRTQDEPVAEAVAEIQAAEIQAADIQAGQGWDLFLWWEMGVRLFVLREFNRKPQIWDFGCCPVFTQAHTSVFFGRCRLSCLTS